VIFFEIRSIRVPLQRLRTSRVRATAKRLLARYQVFQQIITCNETSILRPKLRAFSSALALRDIFPLPRQACVAMVLDIVVFRRPASVARRRLVSTIMFMIFPGLRVACWTEKLQPHTRRPPRVVFEYGMGRGRQPQIHQRQPRLRQLRKYTAPARLACQSLRDEIPDAAPSAVGYRFRTSRTHRSCARGPSPLDRDLKRWERPPSEVQGGPLGRRCDIEVAPARLCPCPMRRGCVKQLISVHQISMTVK